MNTVTLSSLLTNQATNNSAASLSSSSASSSPVAHLHVDIPTTSTSSFTSTKQPNITPKQVAQRLLNMTPKHSKPKWIDPSANDKARSFLQSPEPEKHYMHTIPEVAQFFQTTPIFSSSSSSSSQESYLIPKSYYNHKQTIITNNEPDFPEETENNSTTLTSHHILHPRPVVDPALLEPRSPTVDPRSPTVGSHVFFPNSSLSPRASHLNTIQTLHRRGQLTAYEKTVLKELILTDEDRVAKKLLTDAAQGKQQSVPALKLFIKELCGE